MSASEQDPPPAPSAAHEDEDDALGVTDAFELALDVPDALTADDEPPWVDAPALLAALTPPLGLTEPGADDEAGDAVISLSGLIAVDPHGEHQEHQAEPLEALELPELSPFVVDGAEPADAMGPDDEPWALGAALPELGEEDGGELAAPLPALAWLATADEARPAWAPHRYVELVSRRVEGSFAWFSESPAGWLAGGPTGLHAGAGGDRAAAGLELVDSAVLHGEPPRLLAVTRQAAVVGWALGLDLPALMPLGALPASQAPWQLASSGSRLFARSSLDRLWRSLDGGRSFHPLSLRGRVLTLASEGDAATALLLGRGRVELARSTDGGSSWAITPLAWAGHGRTSELLLGARGDFIAVAERASGLSISRDGGLSFSRVPGTTGATALYVTGAPGGERVFVALYDEAKGTAEVVEYAGLPGEARRVLELSLAPEEAAADEPPRIEALLWMDGELWLATSAGLRCHRLDADTLAH